jgi:hypothetical protein
MPPLSVHNRFAALSVDKISKFNSNSTTNSNKTKAIPTVPSCSQLPHHAKWEKRLPECYIVAVNPSLNSFELKIFIQTTDTGEVHTTAVLLDSGTTGLFMNSEFMKQKRLTTKPLSRLIPVYNVERSLNEADSISEVVEVVLQYQDHSERATFAVTSLGKQDVILGLTWALAPQT